MKLSDFIGTWVLGRTIHDHKENAQSRLQGIAVIDETGLYREEGKLTLPDGAVIQAARQYQWNDHADGIEVFFDDSRPFHVISFDTLRDQHWCDPDTYSVEYDFTAFPNWQAIWHVTGPRKDYTLTSRYRKHT